MPFFVFLGAVALGGGLAALTTKKLGKSLPAWITSATANLRNPAGGGGGNSPGPLGDLGKLTQGLAVSAAGLTQSGNVTTQNIAPPHDTSAISNFNNATSGGTSGGGGSTAPAPTGGGGGGSFVP